MKDLTELLDFSSVKASKGTSNTIDDGKFSSVLFSQTQECKELVTSAFRFEGITTPAIVSNDDDAIIDHVSKSNMEIVLIELNVSEDVVQDAKRISRLLPNDASVIVIGSEDAISTIRNLKSMGFYYVFWPISKQELIDFVNNVYDNREQNKNIGKKRIAKQIAVIGTKGGVGTSFLTTELAHVMAHGKKSNSVIIDCDFISGDQDIFLGLKNFQRQEIGVKSLDVTGEYLLGESFSKKIDNKLSLLSIQSNEISPQDLFEYTVELAKQVNPNTNFVFYDLSASISFYLDLRKQIQAFDVIVLVIEPTISSVREALKYIKIMDDFKDSTNTRLITVFNHSRSDKGVLVSMVDAEEYLNMPFTATIPYFPNTLATIVQGKRVSVANSAIGNKVDEIVSQILGEEVKKKKNFFSRFPFHSKE